MGTFTVSATVSVRVAEYLLIWPALAATGYLGLDVHSTGTVCGAIGDAATGTHGELWYTRKVTAMLL